MAVDSDTPVKRFFNDIAQAVKDAMPSGNADHVRGQLSKFFSHMSPDNRSGGRRSDWPTSSRLLLNSLRVDGQPFPGELSVLNNVVARPEGGLMGIEYMGYDKDVGSSVAQPKFRLMTLTLPAAGVPLVGNEGIVTYYADRVPDRYRNNKDYGLMSVIDKVVSDAVATNGSEHVRVVEAAVRKGYQDLSQPARLKKLIMG